MGKSVNCTDIAKNLSDLSLLINEIIPLILKWAQNSYGSEIIKTISEAFSHFSLSYYKKYTDRIEEGSKLITSLEQIKFIIRILIFGNLINTDKHKLEKLQERACCSLAALDTQIDKWNSYLNKQDTKD